MIHINGMSKVNFGTQKKSISIGNVTKQLIPALS